MKDNREIPSLENRFPEVDAFIHRLVNLYETGNLHSWEELDRQTKEFFTPSRMDQMELIVPGWYKMASYREGVTLTHVTCAFLGMYRMPEFLSLAPVQQTMMKWVVLFHDLEKEVKNEKRDYTHAFRSAVTATRQLPALGFQKQPEFDTLLPQWSELTLSAHMKAETSSDVVQDNRKIPEILAGIERMFGRNTPPALIVKTILFHLSIDMTEWPPPNPLTNEEIRRFIDRDLLSLLRIMHLADSDGWALFGPDRERLRKDTLEVFEQVNELITS